ncbi:MAG: glycosyltransferase family 2 protein [Bacteroidia bacterium]|jgi:glycosyltransferase involved in cell wall biosynthesis|nr:glycosyltransferase family 2 protein [Sphingobacteriaceae bacterium]MBP9069935.1 glycosyltransferase family 2 protein [Bacteroidia bacterium]
MDISVIIPLLNEEESLPELHEWIVKVMTENKFSYEIIFIDDGSKDKSWQVIESLSKANPNTKAVKFRRNYGKSPALYVGFEAAEGDVIITMDADLQDSPDEIPGLYNMIVKENYDLVSGWKQKRYDNAVTKNIPSKLFNYTTRKMSGIKLHDMNCGLKAYKKEVVKSIEVYGEMHRFIPVLAKSAGFTKIGEKVVQHRARKYGTSKFGWSRFINGFLDLLTISFLSKFGKRPMHFFGLLGTLLFFVGFAFAFYLGAYKLYCVFMHHPARLLTQRPSFYISLTCMIIGSMMFLAGFIGELVLRNSSIRNNYLLDKKINLN